MVGGKNVWRGNDTRVGLLVQKLWEKNKPIKYSGSKLRMSSLTFRKKD